MATQNKPEYVYRKGTMINREFNGFEWENTYQKIRNVGNKCNKVNCFLVTQLSSSHNANGFN